MDRQSEGHLNLHRVHKTQSGCTKQYLLLVFKFHLKHIKEFEHVLFLVLNSYRFHNFLLMVNRKNQLLSQMFECYPCISFSEYFTIPLLLTFSYSENKNSSTG